MSITYVNEGDLATPSNMNEWLNAAGAGVYNVQDSTYGATGDGSTDDTTAIQAAIDAAEADGGGVVFFPPGAYYITSALTITGAKGVILRGAAHANGQLTGIAGRPVRIVSNQAINLLEIGITTGGIVWSGATVENIAFADTSGSNNTVTNAITLANIAGVVLRNVAVIKVRAGAAVRAFNCDGSVQYTHIINPAFNDVKFGFFAEDGSYPADTQIIGGVLDNSTFPQTGASSGSIGIRMPDDSVDDGGSIRVIGTNVQRFETDMELFRNAQIMGVRFETASSGTVRHIDVVANGYNIALTGLLFTNTAPSSEHIRINSGATRVRINNISRSSGQVNITDNGDRTVINGLGTDTQAQNLPNSFQWEIGDIVDFTDSVDASGDGVYILGADGSTWTQLA